MAGIVLGAGGSAVGPAQAQTLTHLTFQMQIDANKTPLSQCGGWAWSMGQERLCGGQGGKGEEATH